MLGVAISMAASEQVCYAQTRKAKASLQVGALAVDLTISLNCSLSLCRLILEPAVEGRLRLDAGTWGTMGVGLGYAIAAATCTDRLVVAVEGDSAFGFSGMEVETIVRCVVKSVSKSQTSNGRLGIFILPKSCVKLQCIIGYHSASSECCTVMIVAIASNIVVNL